MLIDGKRNFSGSTTGGKGGRIADCRTTINSIPGIIVN